MCFKIFIKILLISKIPIKNYRKQFSPSYFIFHNRTELNARINAHKIENYLTLITFLPRSDGTTFIFALVKVLVSSAP